MKIATWNVNSIRARLPAAKAWLRDTQPDVLCMQEIKTVELDFPSELFEELGYNCAVYGQKTYNGVAILSKRPIEDVTRGLRGNAGNDEQARYIEALVPGDKGVLRVASVYAPNGNPTGTEKFAYKLEWMARLKARATALLANEEPCALMGDYNVIPEDEDCHDPAAWAADALTQPEARAVFRAIETLGYTDAFRAKNLRPSQFTFWDYQHGAWQKNYGIRIDMILLSPQALDRMRGCTIDKAVRGGDKPSDHVPVICDIDI